MIYNNTAMKKMIYMALAITVMVGCNQPAPQNTEAATPTPEAKPGPNTCEWGKAESAKDFGEGKLMLIQLGKPGPANAQYWDLLATKYNITQKSDAGCTATESITCYNDFMRTKIEEKHGMGFLDKVYASADSMYQASAK